MENKIKFKRYKNYGDEGYISLEKRITEILETITPDPCYNIADVLVDGSSVGAVTSYTFNNVTANYTITATFAIGTFTITASQ